MTIALWIINILLAVAFLGSGSVKLARSKDDLVAMGMGYAESFSPGTLKAIGGTQVLGALGLILPLATGILPVLTPIAAVALALLMFGAVGVHIQRREGFAPAAVLAALSVASAVLGFLAVI